MPWGCRHVAKRLQQSSYGQISLCGLLVKDSWEIDGKHGIHPWNLEPKHEGLEDCCPFQIDDFPGCSPWFISICQSNLLPIFWCLLFCFSWHPVLYWQVKQYRTLKRFMMVVIIEKNQIAAKVWVCDDCLQNSCEHLFITVYFIEISKRQDPT